MFTDILKNRYKRIEYEVKIEILLDWIWGCLKQRAVSRIQWGHIWGTAALLPGLWGRRWAWSLLRTSLSTFPMYQQRKTTIVNVCMRDDFRCIHTLYMCMSVLQVLCEVSPSAQKQVCRWFRLRGVWRIQRWCWRLSLWWPSASGCSPSFPETKTTIWLSTKFYFFFFPPFYQLGCWA